MKYDFIESGAAWCKKACAVLTLALATALPTQAQVTVDASIDSLQLLIGEQTKIRLQVSLDADKKLQMPLFQDTIIRGVEIVDVAKADTQYLNDRKRMLVTQEYTVTSFDSALYYLPPFEVKVNNEPYLSKSLALKVYSVPVDTLHPDQFFGPKSIQEVPVKWEDIAPIVWFGLLFLAMAAACVFLVIRYKDNKPIIKIIKVEPKLPPHLAAMKKMDEIKAEKSWQKGDPKVYYTELTDVIRTYIKERFGFNAMEMTSGEIIERLTQEQDKASIDEMRLLFETADLVKFAKHAPLMNENDMNLLNAIEFINHTKIEPDPNAKQEPTEIRVEEKRSKQGRIALMCCIGLTGVIGLGAIYMVIRQIIALCF